MRKTLGLWTLAVGITSIFAAQANTQNCTVPAGVEVIPAATLGTGGAPALLVTGVPGIGQASNLVHSGGPPNALGCIVASASEAPVFVPAFGATLYPGADSTRVIICFQLDANGQSPPLLQAFDSINASLCGQTYVAQSLVLDPLAKGGVLFSDALRVRFGSGVDLPITADQDSLLTNNPTQVRITVEIADGSLVNGDGVQLFEVNDDFAPQGAALCQLLDNGSLGNGDDISGDGLFSCLNTVQVVAAGELQLAARATIAGQDFWTRIIALQVVDPLTNAQSMAIAAGQMAAISSWEASVAAFGDTTEARNATVQTLLGLPDVAEAGISTDGFTIWIHYTSGVRGGLMLNPEGTRGRSVPSADDDARSDQTASVIGLPTPLLPTMRDASTPSGLIFVGAAEPTITGNNRVMIWDAYNSQFAPFDEAPALKMLYEMSTCPTFEITTLTDAQATVASVRTFTSFGTVILVTHGAVDGDGQVVFLTRESATPGAILLNAIDLILGRISIMGDVFAIRPSFVSGLSGSFEDGILYNGSCQSTANSTMNTAFFGKGMKTAFGFTKVVNSDFAQGSATQLFTSMVDDDKTTGEAFATVAPLTDPTSPFAVFTQSGDANVKYSGAFRNGSFEDELEGWTTAGDGRTLVGLGEFSPEDGARMGIISTGLGFTTDSGSIQQEFCLPMDATTLSFDWNYSSEEFIEYCNSEFDDLFRVTLTTEAGTTVLLTESVNSLCGGVVPSNLFFDQSAPPCNPTEDVGFGTGGNDCIVWTTGWTQASIDITAIATAAAGGPVTLRFESTDIGDSIYDTAILLDDIVITAP